MPSIEAVLKQATQRLSDQHDNPRLDAEVLLCHLLGKDRSYLRAWPEAELTAEQQQTFDVFIARRARGEPVAHITGEREFWSLPLQVSADTLIPRPETELLVELALEKIPADAPWRIADLGTGSGAIALALASERPHSQFMAVDQSEQALAVAKANAQALALRNVTFRHGSWLEPIAESLDLIVSNPPYIPEQDPHLGQGDVRFEPRSALASGPDGLNDIRIIIEQSLKALRPGGWLLIEHGYDQGKAVAQLLSAASYRSVATQKDWQGHPRVSLGQCPP